MAMESLPSLSESQTWKEIVKTGGVGDEGAEGADGNDAVGMIAEEVRARRI